MKYYALLFFLTLGMTCMGYKVETMTVTRVENGIVKMGDYTIPEAEAWRVGDEAEAIIREGEIIEVRFVR